MSNPKPGRLLADFLEDGIVELPDRTYEAIRREIHATQQRSMFGSRALPIGSMGVLRLATAALLIVAVGVAIVTLAPRLGLGSPQPTSTSAAAVVPLSSPMAPGRYRFTWPTAAGTDGEAGPSITITIPAPGWTSFAQFAADKNSDGVGVSFVVWKITNVYADPCSHATALSPAPGAGIDELLAALADQPGIQAGSVTPVTIDGYSGKSVDLRVTQDIAACNGGFYPWLDKVVEENQETLRVYALDVDGFRLTFFLRIPQGTAAADLAELNSIVASVGIDP